VKLLDKGGKKTDKRWKKAYTKLLEKRSLAETKSEVKKLKNGLAALGRNRDSSEEQEPE